MGLNCSHGAFDGAYSAFNRFRQEVAKALGCKYPPHDDKSLDQDMWYTADGMTREKNPGVYEFFCHSDCDGEIDPEMCKKVADELSPALDLMPEESGGHIARNGGYKAVLQKFIDGCMQAHEAGESLEFH